MIEALRSRASQIKEITIAINQEVRDQNRLLDSMGSDFDAAGASLHGTINRVRNMITSGVGNHLVHMVVFAFLIIVFVYFFAAR